MDQEISKFSTPSTSTGQSNKKLWLVLLLIIILAIAAYFVFWYQTPTEKGFIRYTAGGLGLDNKPVWMPGLIMSLIGDREALDHILLSDNETGRTEKVFKYQTEEDISEIMTAYQEALITDGWQVIAFNQDPEAPVWNLVAEKSPQKFYANFTPQESGTKIDITLVEE